jgi:hypothetical protein
VRKANGYVRSGQARQGDQVALAKHGLLPAVSGSLWQVRRSYMVHADQGTMAPGSISRRGVVAHCRGQLHCAKIVTAQLSLRSGANVISRDLNAVLCRRALRREAGEDWSMVPLMVKDALIDSWD